MAPAAEEELAVEEPELDAPVDVPVAALTAEETSLEMEEMSEETAEEAEEAAEEMEEIAEEVSVPDVEELTPVSVDDDWARTIGRGGTHEL